MRLPRLANENLRLELLAIIKRHAYSQREVTLASGQKSNFYIDCKQISFRGDGATALGRLFFEAMKLREQHGVVLFGACGGMALGAVPISLALTMQAFSEGRDLPSLTVRKEVKEHGTRSAVEGAAGIIAGSQILLVEDVVTSGQSTIKAAIALRDAGFAVDYVMAIVDRQAGGEENLKSHGLVMHSLFDLSDF